MDTKNIVMGLVIGVLVGAVGIYAVDQSRFSQLSKQIKSLEDLIDSQQDIIDSQEAAVLIVDTLRAEVNASRELIKEYEDYKESADTLIEKLTEDYTRLNILCAQQTYRLEEALTQLNNYDPEYEPGTEFSFVFGDLSFEDWWEINGGPFEEWWSRVYG